MSLTVSVVIPTKNAGRMFHDVLDRLRQQQPGDHLQIVVVDSGSTDDTLLHAKHFGAEIRTIPPGTFNHGATRNLGISVSQGDIVVLMTQDAIPGNELLLQQLVAPFEDRQVAGSYARQVPRAEADILTKRNLHDASTGRTRPEVRSITNRKEYDALSPMERYLFCTFDNVCSAVRRTAWEQIGFPSTDFGEDIAWSKCVLEAGWKIAYQPLAEVIHSHERPIGYEYKRTYLCHRTLYDLFGLSTIPTLKQAFRCACLSMARDSTYVLKHARSPVHAARLLLRLPALSIATTFAQYHGARDVRRGQARTYREI